MRAGRHRTKTAVASDNACDTLRELKLHAGVAKKCTIIVRVGIDEARSKVKPVAVNLCCVVRDRPRGISHACYPSIFNCDITIKRLGTGAIENVDISDCQL